MHSIIHTSSLNIAKLSIESNLGFVTQVRNHVKIYPWRTHRDARESYLDPTTTPYTDRHNINEFRPSILKSKNWKKKEWQKVIPKEKDNRFNPYKWNDAYKSDPVEAKETASSKLKRFQDSLKSRGSARECEAYNPPENVSRRIMELYRSHKLEVKADAATVNKQSDEDVLGLDLDQNRAVKVNLIRQCIAEFNHELPNSYLNEIKYVRDLVDYYETPVRGVNPYTALLRKESSLPENLALIPDAMRFDKETDVFFGGHTAYPGMVSKVPGLRGEKRYPTLNQDEFQWPDI